VSHKNPPSAVTSGAILMKFLSYRRTKNRPRRSARPSNPDFIRRERFSGSHVIIPVPERVPGASRAERGCRNVLKIDEAVGEQVPKTCLVSGN
jgi:hypothetical protein